MMVIIILDVINLFINFKIMNEAVSAVRIKKNVNFIEDCDYFHWKTENKLDIINIIYI